jgi:septal ring factor EnvC (AmiA/AmiB activator)
VQGVLSQDPAAPVGGRSGGPTCEFCNCSLAADGAVLKTSDRARQLARIDEKIERLEGELAAAKAANTELQTQLTAAVTELQDVKQSRPAPAAKSRGLHFGDD